MSARDSQLLVWRDREQVKEAERMMFRGMPRESSQVQIRSDQIRSMVPVRHVMG